MKSSSENNLSLFTKMCSRSNVIKIFAFTACAVGFFVISWHLLKDFTSGSTIVSTNYVQMSPDETLLSPTILICNKTGFKSDKTSTTLEDYLNDTIDPKDLFYDMGYINQDNQPLVLNKMRSIYTPYRGRCFVFEPAVRVSMSHF